MYKFEDTRMPVCTSIFDMIPFYVAMDADGNMLKETLSKSFEETSNSLKYNGKNCPIFKFSTFMTKEQQEKVGYNKDKTMTTRSGFMVKEIVEC